MKAIDPFSNRLLRDYPEFSNDMQQEAIKCTHHAHTQWKPTSISERTQLRLSLGYLLRRKVETLAKRMTF
jgi:acyl-CoA reductase-like NAD-dependent aldehyde dehydrogenase